MELELWHICQDRREYHHIMYGLMYNRTGDYEATMKYHARMIRKWTKRINRVLYDKRLQDAMIRWF